MSVKSLLIIISLVVAGAVIYYETRSPSNPPATVPQVDIARYLGVWYEISSIPFYWSEGCACTTANYSLRSDGDIKVINSCYRNGEFSSNTGRAWAVDSTNSKLKVEFFWPFSGDYWIVALDADYQWVVVSNPNRDLLWILSRTVELDDTLHQNIISSLKNSDFPVEKMDVTDQSVCNRTMSMF